MEPKRSKVCVCRECGARKVIALSSVTSSSFTCRICASLLAKEAKPPHPLGTDSKAAPVRRHGRRVADSAPRVRSTLLPMTEEEHASLRRVSSHLGYSQAETLRILIREKEMVLWPDPSSRPNVLQLDMEEAKKKEQLKKKTEAWRQKKRNAFQRKEARLRQEADRARLRKEASEAKERKALLALSKMEKVRAERRDRTEKMRQEVSSEKYEKKETERAEFQRVEKTLLAESMGKKRKLTESEKWALGKKLRGEVR